MRITVVGFICFLGFSLAIQYTPRTLRSHLNLDIDITTFPAYTAHHFHNRVDHYNESDTRDFPQRYWVNSRHYDGAPNPPIFLLEAGETDGVARLDALDRGIVNHLAQATNGIAIVLEHRYYGDSLPFKIFTQDTLRYLTYNQSLEDSVKFARDFHTLDHPHSASLNTAQLNHSRWIVYGGSYAGARAAHLRTLHPDVFFGGIGSSAVVHAEDDYWRYFDMIRLHQDGDCVNALSQAVQLIDAVLDLPLALPKHALKRLFGLSGLSDEDFVDTITYPLAFVQGENWDEEVSAHEFQSFCNATAGDGLVKRLLTFTPNFTLIPTCPPSASLPLGHAAYALVQYARWIDKHVATQLRAAQVRDRDATNADASAPSSMRAWGYQVCTQWGYFQGAPPVTAREAYAHRLVSKRLTLEQTSSYCLRDYNITHRPHIEEVNSLGDFQTHAHRLAFIDGSADPWREATAHSSRAGDRLDSIGEPSIVIPKGTHHWDENGWLDRTQEPPLIRNVHDYAVSFVSSWLEERV
ncbi:hypothetical protein E3P91_03813 [Wallemia ichthyophaga]|nr:hypothetical protein E3P91_03813 [Wallemia ichthyophaga]